MKKLRRIVHNEGVRSRLRLALISGFVLVVTIAVQKRAGAGDGALLLELQTPDSSRSLAVTQNNLQVLPAKPESQAQPSADPKTGHAAPWLPTPVAGSKNDVVTATVKRPITKSLHPKWKLWHEMNTEQQEAALQDLGPYLRKYGAMIERRNFKLQIPQELICELWIPGSAHRLCGPAPPNPCTFLSFGINNDPSYDIQLAEQWGCRGFAADPTIVHPSKLHPLVTFHNLALTTLRPNEEKMVRPEEDWWYTSMPALRKFLHLDHVDIMKIDCEGCEVALSRDILAEDPTFFHKVGQMTIETHITKAWIQDREELYYFGLLFPLLEEAGHVMVSSMVFGCNIKHERYGCMPEFGEWGFPCGLGPHRKVAKSCHDFLFVKKEKAYRNGVAPPVEQS